MVRYFYAFIPFLIVFGTAVLVAAPPLALAAIAIGLFYGFIALTRAAIAGAHRVGHTSAPRGEAVAEPTPVPIFTFGLGTEPEERDVRL